MTINKKCIFYSKGVVFVKINKYRAWDKFEEEMFVPSSRNNHESFFMGTNDKGLLMCTESPYQKQSDSDWVLMQYIGIDDMNNAEIYEEDILKIDIVGRTYYGCVRFESGAFVANGLNLSTIHGFGTIEVVGNTFENPELLKA